MNTGTDLSSLYELRNNYTVIGLTGRTCSGCSTIATQLASEFDDNVFPNPTDFTGAHNSYKKYKIIYNYSKENYQKYDIIKYKDVLTLIILKYQFQDFIDFLNSKDLKERFRKSGLKMFPDFKHEITEISCLKSTFEELSIELQDIDLEHIKNDDNLSKLNQLFTSDKFVSFTNALHANLAKKSIVKRNKTLQVLANNLRRGGTPYDYVKKEAKAIFTIVELVNDLIKSFKRGDITKVVIDSLRNPFEILFFKQRFAAFYLISVNREQKNRDLKIQTKFPGEYTDVIKILDEEYKGGKGNEFYKQYVRECIEKADIHITYRSLLEITDLNIDLSDHTSPYFSWQMQLLKYLALINHPGLVTPSPEERCMQMAYSAKYNSGCISRQVGAAITDDFYSLRAVGWNNTPEGQTPCNLRNAEDLMKREGSFETVFTPYEREDQEFKSVLHANFEQQIIDNKQNLKGRNVCFCFKSLKNSCSEGKNQVHTRSLHAEESAFLQITKYGGTGIKGGKLFTTASPCELCAKKAYQLGIRVIYYVDPYPGISQRQILEAGSPTRNPDVRLFNGVIGNAYHWLYEPLMAYKDELSLLLGQNVKDLTSTLEDKLKDKETTILDQSREIEQLRETIRYLEDSKTS